MIIFYLILHIDMIVISDIKIRVIIGLRAYLTNLHDIIIYVKKKKIKIFIELLILIIENTW